MNFGKSVWLPAQQEHRVGFVVRRNEVPSVIAVSVKVAILEPLVGLVDTETSIYTFRELRCTQTCDPQVYCKRTERGS